MNVTLTPDLYEPTIDNDGNYIDRKPTIINGIKCPCSFQTKKVYDFSSKFATHIKSKGHKKWLIQLNRDKMNHYILYIKQKDLIEDQKRIIADFDIKNQNNLMTINYLTHQLVSKSNNIREEQPLIDLLDI